MVMGMLNIYADGVDLLPEGKYPAVAAGRK